MRKFPQRSRIESQTRLGVDAHIKYQFFVDFGSRKAAIDPCNSITFEAPDQVQDYFKEHEVQGVAVAVAAPQCTACSRRGLAARPPFALRHNIEPQAEV